MPKFVTEDDIEALKDENINYETDIIQFLDEIKDHFNSISQDKIDKINSIDELNKKYLLNYPSWGGYYILEDSFSGVPVNFSYKSKYILNYFYGISLRY